MAQDQPGTTNRINRGKIDSEFIRNKLQLKSQEIKKSFAEKYPHVESYLKSKGAELGKIRHHSAKIISAGALTGTLLLSPPQGLRELPTLPEISRSLTDLNETKNEMTNRDLVDLLNQSLPEKRRALTRDEERHLSTLFENAFEIKAKGTLEGEHLNTTYGLIGAEQHLKRFQGDSMAVHPKVAIDDEGMAPGRGAWGYVPQDVEEWYAVVQTLYLPDWARRQPYLRDWYKHRKVLIVNTQNGNAVVAAIADSGPAAWTGKSFGGSPEVMNYLGGARYKKGPVILFFVDDPENKVPLGPIEYNGEGQSVLNGKTI